ncbi:hypothetical protein Hanom_Chr00s025378g01764401 [Helianthus anomalus]
MIKEDCYDIPWEWVFLNLALCEQSLHQIDQQQSCPFHLRPPMWLEVFQHQHKVPFF